MIRSVYAVFLALLLSVYAGIYGAFLIHTDFLPYVYDNNESFSSLLHATNLYTFGLRDSVGLADESMTAWPEGHPYVHTHQGNFPRIYAFLTYVLGARSIESQILITTFTIGILAIVLAYRVFADLCGPVLSFVICLFLLTDYIHIAQWQIVTYRVWHLFFVFSSLTCAIGIGGQRRRLWLALTFVNYLCLFYYELVFVAFVSILAGLFIVGRYWRRPWLIVSTALTQFAAATLALGVLFGQMALYAGWDALVTDLTLTFLARNDSASDPALLSKIDEFYRVNHIVFWRNIMDAAPLRTIEQFMQVHLHLVIQVYTPLLTLVAVALAGGWLLGLPRSNRWLSLDRSGRLDTGRRTVIRVQCGQIRGHVGLEFGLVGLPTKLSCLVPGINAIARFAILAGPLAYVILIVARDDSFLGNPNAMTASPAEIPSLVWAEALTLATAIGLLLTRAATASWTRVDRVPLGRLLVAAGFLVAFGQLVQLQGGFYDLSADVLWYQTIPSIVPTWAQRYGLLLVVSFATSLIVLGTATVLGAGQTRGLVRVAGYMAYAAVAYVFVYRLATGYVYTGYVVRSAPLAVFVVGVFYAWGICIAVAALVRLCSVVTCCSLDTPSDNIRRPMMYGALVAAAVLILSLAGYWAALNSVYVGLLPPTQAAFLRQFGEPPLHGKSVASNGYAAPIAAFSGYWAYIDPEIGQGNVRLTNRGYVVERDLETYLWFADRDSNAEYQRPDYYVCFKPVSMERALERLKGARRSHSSCSETPLVQQIERGDQQILAHRLVAQDPAGGDAWSIIALEWDYPPFLNVINARRPGERVRLVETPTASGLRIEVSYRYVHQNREPEGASIIRLYGRSADRQVCQIAESTTGKEFELPADFSGTIRASVTPRTATKTGIETTGEWERLGAGAENACTGR